MSLPIATIGQSIRRLRLARKLTQQQLADAVSCHRVNITQLELGKYNPSLELLYRIAEKFDVAICNLLPHSRNSR